MCTGLLFNQVRLCFASQTSVGYLALRNIDSTLQRQNANHNCDSEEEAASEMRPTTLGAGLFELQAFAARTVVYQRCSGSHSTGMIQMLYLLKCIHFSVIFYITLYTFSNK